MLLLVANAKHGTGWSYADPDRHRYDSAWDHAHHLTLPDADPDPVTNAHSYADSQANADSHPQAKATNAYTQTKAIVCLSSGEQQSLVL